MDGSVYSMIGFEKGYKQALADFMEKYKDMEDYDEIFVKNMRRHAEKLQEGFDENERKSVDTKTD